MTCLRSILPVVFPALVIGLGCAEPPNPGTLTYYFYYDPRSLDPALSTDVPTGEVMALLFDNLTQFDTEGELTLGLARGWELDRTGLHYTFHLRSNAKFHDGRPVTAGQASAELASGGLVQFAVVQHKDTKGTKSPKTCRVPCT